MFTVIIFIIVLSVLVLVHEAGHFFVAKKAGMKVEEFGFGFPPRIFGFRRGETLYSINWIPFGGFVKIMGEDDNQNKDARSFAAGKARTRAAVIVAGVIMNLVLAVFLLMVANFIGARVGLDDQKSLAAASDIRVEIIEVAPDSPAGKAGLQLLDQIVSLKYGSDTTAVTNIDQVQSFIASHLDQLITVDYIRNGRAGQAAVQPRSVHPANEGALGITMTLTGIVHYPWYQSISRAFVSTWDLITATVGGFALVIHNLFATGKAGVELSGPVGIAVFTGKAAHFGFSYLLQFVAFMSVNLAVLNIIPFPALDGGRLFLILIEKLKGSPLSKRVEATINTVGFALLLALMVYVTTKDIIKLF